MFTLYFKPTFGHCILMPFAVQPPELAWGQHWTFNNLFNLTLDWELNVKKGTSLHPLSSPLFSRHIKFVCSYMIGCTFGRCYQVEIYSSVFVIVALITKAKRERDRERKGEREQERERYLAVSRCLSWWKMSCPYRSPSARLLCLQLHSLSVSLNL